MSQASVCNVKRRFEDIVSDHNCKFLGQLRLSTQHDDYLVKRRSPKDCFKRTGKK